MLHRLSCNPNLKDSKGKTDWMRESVIDLLFGIDLGFLHRSRTNLPNYFEIITDYSLIQI
jgi:hypothetical protein